MSQQQTQLEPVLRKRAGNVKWSIFVPGSLNVKPTWLPTRTDNELEARKLLEVFRQHGGAEMAAAMRNESVARVFMRRLVVGKQIPFREAIDEYLSTLILQGRAKATLYGVAKVLERFSRVMECGTRPLAEVTTTTVSPYINPENSPLAYSTRCERLNILNGFFEWAVSREKIPQNPCLDMRVRTEGIPQDKLVKKKKAPFTDEDVARLLASYPTDSWWYGVMLLGKHFGLRIAAAVTLEWACLPELKRLRIFTHKGRVVVDEPLPDEVAAWFRTWPRSETGYCFPQGVGTFYNLEFWKKLRDLGLSGKSFRSFRVRTVTNGINAVLGQLGGEERAVMSALLVRHGVAGVQRLVGHVAGSSVTAGRYFNPQPTT